MYQSKYYTCEEIDERLLKGYYDDAVSKGYQGTFEQLQLELASVDLVDLNLLNGNAGYTMTEAVAKIDELSLVYTSIARFRYTDKTYNKIRTLIYDPTKSTTREKVTDISTYTLTLTEFNGDIMKTLLTDLGKIGFKGSVYITNSGFICGKVSIFGDSMGHVVNQEVLTNCLLSSDHTSLEISHNHTKIFKYDRFFNLSKSNIQDRERNLVLSHDNSIWYISTHEVDKRLTDVEGQLAAILPGANVSPSLFGFLPWGSENNGPDNLDFSAIFNNEQPLTYYMTRAVRGENVVVGVLQCYGDSFLHGVVQVYESIEFLNSEGKFDGSHRHTELKKYSRYYDGSTFTAWKEVGGIGDVSITEAQLSDSVKNLLLHRIDWSNLHTAKLGKYIVTNNDIPVGYVNTLSLNNLYQVQIFTTTMVYDEENVTFVSGTSYSNINTYIRRYNIEHDEWDDWEDFTDSGGSGDTVTADATYKPILPESTVITNSVGGIKPGTTISSLSGKTFSQVLEMMLVSESWNNPNYTHNISVSTPESPVKVGSTAVLPDYNATWNSNIQSDSEKEIDISFDTNLIGTVYKKAGTYTYTLTYSYPAGYYTITSNLGNTKTVTVPAVLNATIIRSVIATYPWFINNTEQALVAIGSSKTVEVELTGSPSIKVPFTNSKVTIQADLGFGWMDVSWDEYVDNSNLGNAIDETVPYKVYTKPDSYASSVKHRITIKLSK